MPGKGEVGFDGDAAGAVTLCSGQLGEPAGEAGRGDAGSPNDGAAGDALRAAVSALERHAGGVDPDHGAACEDGYAEALQRPLGLRRERGWEARQDTIGGLDEQDAGAARIDGAEVAPQRVPRQLGDLAGHLDAGGAGADDDEREPRVARRWVRLDLGGLEGGEEPAANGECTLERLDLGGVQPPFLVAEVRVVRAAGDDQRVVAEPFRRRHRPDGAQVQLTRVEVEVGDLGQQDADVAVALEDRAERIGDLAGRERPGRDLVGERLEEMEVAAVDERHLDRRTPQLRHRLQAAETSADDDDVVVPGPKGAHSAPLFPSAPGQFPVQARLFAGCQPGPRGDGRGSRLVAVWCQLVARLAGGSSVRGFPDQRGGRSEPAPSRTEVS